VLAKLAAPCWLTRPTLVQVYLSAFKNLAVAEEQRC
jgi:hypothetical protein